MIKENKRLILIFLIALVLRLILFLAAGSWQNRDTETRIALSDTKSYTKIALNLVKNKIFSRSESPPYHPEMFYTPIYPLFLASIYSILGYKPYIPILLQLLIGSATCLFVYKVGKILFNERTALLAGLFLAFEYSNILYSNVLLTENLFIFLFVVHVFFLVKYLTTDIKKWLVYSALFLGLSTLTRPISVYFFLFLIMIFLAYFRKNLIQGILKYFTFTLIFLGVLAPWIARNYAVSGKPLVSTVQEQILGWGIYTVSETFIIPKDPPQEEDCALVQSSRSEEFESISRKNTNISLKSLSREYLFATLRFFLNPGSSNYPRLLGLSYSEVEEKDIESLGKTPWKSVKVAIQKKSVLERFIFFYCISFLLFLYITMGVGVYKAIREKKWKGLFLIIIVIMYFTIPSVSIAITQRYRVPIMPFVILLSSYGIGFLHTVVFRRKKSKSNLRILSYI